MSLPGDFLLGRILSGLIALSYNGKTYFYSHPSPKLLYKADLLEEELMKKNEDIMTIEQSIDLLIEMGKWSESKEKEISEEIPRILEDLKMQIYLAYIKRPDDVKSLKEKIKKVKNYLYKLLSDKHRFDEFSCEGLAKKEKTLFLIKRGVKGLDVKADKLLNAFYSSHLDESDIRQVARSEDWLIRWSAMKKGCKVFSKHLTEEQARLIKWATIYDNVMESENPPPESVLNDDDALDGYFLYKKIENKDKAQLEEIEQRYAQKGIKYTELYLPAKDMAEARRNDQLNTDAARRLKEERFKQINAEGVVNEADLRDQRLKLNIMKNRLEMK